MQEQGRPEHTPVAAAGPPENTRVGIPGQTRGRKLHLGHFAFMRAVVQGLDVRDSWQRYLQMEGGQDNVRTINRTIAWMRDAFAAAAKRHARHGIARLVRLDARRIAERESALPTLEAFAEEHGLQDFSQSEQLAQYQACHGAASRRQSRRSRLIDRQLDALLWLEQQVAQRPQAEDAVASWLHPDLAAHLQTTGILTLRQLIDRINGRGRGWWHDIRAIGAGKAARITTWLAAHETEIGLPVAVQANANTASLSPQGSAQETPWVLAIVPLEQCIMPATLDGSGGLYRASRNACRLTASNDIEAVFAWVKSRQAGLGVSGGAVEQEGSSGSAKPEAERAWLHCLSHTQRAYLKEAERFLLWAVVQRNIPMSSITAEDCAAYRAFLADPQPAQRWCGPRGHPRRSPLWRPFEGPLSPRAQRQAVTILKSLGRFLVEQGYLTGNPWSGIALPQAVARNGNFTHAQWKFIERQLDCLPMTLANRRLRCALHLFQATGLRLAESVAVRVDDLQHAVPPAEDTDTAMPWTLTVAGKKQEKRKLPVPHAFMDELATYLAARGLDPDPTHARNKGAFLLGKAIDRAQGAPWSPQAGIQPGTLYKHLKRFFVACAQTFAVNDTQGAQSMAAATTHWLRREHRWSRTNAAE
ncbi:MAG TPA: phage integrase family protein [Noviherbaspirillum sp.]|nr:phage integrase family protein [Noviherbaspirillum sp.]